MIFFAALLLTIYACVSLIWLLMLLVGMVVIIVVFVALAWIGCFRF